MQIYPYVFCRFLLRFNLRDSVPENTVKIQFKGISTWKYNLQARSNHTLPSGVKKAHSGGLGSLLTKKKKDCY